MRTTLMIASALLAGLLAGMWAHADLAVKDPAQPKGYHRKVRKMGEGSGKGLSGGKRLIGNHGGIQKSKYGYSDRSFSTRSGGSGDESPLKDMHANAFAAREAAAGDTSAAQPQGVTTNAAQTGASNALIRASQVLP